VLRDALRAGVEPQLDKADALAPRRRQARRQAIAAELVALADQYAAAGWARAAERTVALAAAFDPAGTVARAAQARAAVQQWNVAQATARAAELQPPADDGAALREWFQKVPQARHRRAGLRRRRRGRARRRAAGGRPRRVAAAPAGCRSCSRRR
jgi:hypothetical protein